MKVKLQLCFSILFLSAQLAFGQWIQLGSDINGEAAGDQFGQSVSISANGSRIAIGAPYNNGNGNDSGQVRIYELQGGAWAQLGNNINGEAAGDNSGFSVSLSADGNRVAIGAIYNNGNGNESGHVRIYDYQGGNWVQLGSDINGEAAGDRSGISVSLDADGSRVAIGAYLNSGNGSFSGHVRVYQLQGANWVKLGPDINGEASGDSSGGSLSLSADGNRVAIGAVHNDGNGTNSGHARVYELQGGNWIQLGADIDGEAAFDWFGQSVSLSDDGTHVAVGAFSAGYFDIFYYDGVDWNQEGTPILGSGRWVSLNDNGSLVAIGITSGTSHGRIYQYDEVNWNQVGLNIVGEGSSDNFGRRVSLSNDGSRVAIGVPENDDNGNNSGKVRIFINTDLSTSDTSVGLESGSNITTGSHNTFLGDHTGFNTTEGNSNTFIGHSSGFSNTTGNTNTYLGRNSGFSNPNGSGNVFLGHRAGYNETGSDLLYIDNSDTASPLLWGDFTADALQFNGTVRIADIPQDNTLTRILTTDIDGNMHWRDITSIGGDDADADPSNEIQGLNFIAGIITLNDDPNATTINLSNYDTDISDDFSGSYNDLTDIPADLANGDDIDDADADPANEFQDLTFNEFTHRLFISDGNSVNLGSLGPDNLGDHLVMQDLLPVFGNALNLGSFGAAFNNIHFNGALYVNDQPFLHHPNNNLALGANALSMITTGTQNVALGENALDTNQNGNNNVAIGYGAGISDLAFGTVSNSTAIGNEAIVAASNQVRIGNYEVDGAGVPVNWTVVSDGRFKINIAEDVAGLDFIKALRPVSYNLDRRKIRTFTGNTNATNSDVSQKTIGFIAQEVAQAVSSNNYVFTGVEQPKNNRDHYGLRYAEFVVPLVKGMQEQQQIIETLEQRIVTLEALLYGTETNSGLAEVNAQTKSPDSFEGFMLYQNTPNPFDNTTVISALIPESVNKAKIIVYNLQGLELESYELNKRGNVSVEISAGRFPSGMYLYALLADDNIIDTKKMILTR